MSTFAFVLIVITAMAILIFRDWRINAGALALQYLAAFALVTLSWPIGLAIVKLITGWMATAAIALTCLRQKNTKDSIESGASLVFRGLSGLLIILLIFILTPTLQARVFPQVDLLILQGGLMLVGMSLMQLGTNSEHYLVVISLLSFLAGFEVIHAALELSMLLAGLMVVVNLGLALVGVYFMIRVGEPDESSEDEALA
ncbi:MAG: hypothetical protein K0B06_06600 [Brevefilum sp.]|nr:hypothetical protein [Brevefilum sp.]